MSNSERQTGWSKDEFLSGCLQRQVFRLQDIDAAASVTAHARAYQDWMIEARVPADQVAALARLTDQGFRLIDTNVQLDCAAPHLRDDSAAGDPIAKGWQVRRAQPADREAVAEIAGSQLQLSRFNLDPQVGHALAALVKRAWVGNFFESKRGDHLFVVDSTAGVAGFLLVLERGAQGIIDLIALDPSVRGTGATEALVRNWLAHSKQLERILVGTQIANTRSLRAYARLGFKVCSATYVLHKHSERAP